MSKVFLSGKIEGASQKQIGLFYTAEAMLIKEGFEVYNSAKSDNTEKWELRLGKCLPELEKCDSVLMIHGYNSHPEPRSLMMIAKSIGISVNFQPALEEDEMNRIIKVIEDVVGINNIKSASREVAYTAGRAILANYCKDNLDMHHNNIAAIVGRRPCSIYNMLYTYDNWMASWPEFRVFVKQFKKSI